MHERYFARFIPLEKARGVPFGVFMEGEIPVRKLAGTRPIQVIFYSNFIKSKGVDEALGCIPLVTRKNGNVKFLFVGAWDSEAHCRDLMRMAESVDIRGRVEFLGVVSGEAKRTCLQESDIFLLPTYYPHEGLPLALLEAMSYGCAVVTTDHAAISSAVAEGVNGFFCRAGDYEDLARRIIQLVDDRELLLRMQERSLHKFRQLFTAERFGEGLAKELSSLMPI